jgi:hypothetical protein
VYELVVFPNGSGMQTPMDRGKFEQGRGCRSRIVSHEEVFEAGSLSHIFHDQHASRSISTIEARSKHATRGDGV